jgi:hypothetical protein
VLHILKSASSGSLVSVVSTFEQNKIGSVTPALGTSLSEASDTVRANVLRDVSNERLVEVSVAPDFSVAGKTVDAEAMGFE